MYECYILQKKVLFEVKISIKMHKKNLRLVQRDKGFFSSNSFSESAFKKMCIFFIKSSQKKSPLLLIKNLSTVWYYSLWPDPVKFTDFADRNSIRDSLLKNSAARWDQKFPKIGQNPYFWDKNEVFGLNKYQTSTGKIKIYIFYVYWRRASIQTAALFENLQYVLT